MAELRKLGNEIKSFRGAVTQQEFARLLGISQGSVAKYENGLAMPGASILLQIAELGKISVEDLLKKTNLTPPLSKSGRPQTSGESFEKEAAGNPEDLTVSLQKIFDIDQKLGELMVNLVKAFSKAAENPDLRIKGRRAVKNALKAIGYSS